MEKLPNCIKSGSEFIYEDGNLYICPECAHEWIINSDLEEGKKELIVKDAHGNVLNDGDRVTITKDIKVKVTYLVIKVGVKIKGIHLVEKVNGHNIDAKVKGIGSMMLKSEFV